MWTANLAPLLRQYGLPKPRPRTPRPKRPTRPQKTPARHEDKKETTMRSDLSFTELLDAAMEEPERSVPAVVEAVMTGADRADDITTPEAKAAAFQKIISDVAG